MWRARRGAPPAELRSYSLDLLTYVSPRKHVLRGCLGLVNLAVQLRKTRDSAIFSGLMYRNLVQNFTPLVVIEATPDLIQWAAH